VRDAIFIVIRGFVHVPGILAMVNMEMPGERIVIMERSADSNGRMWHPAIRRRDLRDENHRPLRNKRQGRGQHKRAGNSPELPMQSQSHSRVLGEIACLNKAADLAERADG